MTLNYAYVCNYVCMYVTMTGNYDTNSNNNNNNNFVCMSKYFSIPACWSNTVIK